MLCSKCAAVNSPVMQEGISTIITAINRSRKIFRRIEAYIIYRKTFSVDKLNGLKAPALWRLKHSSTSTGPDCKVSERALCFLHARELCKTYSIQVLTQASLAGTSSSITILLFFFFATICMKFVMPTWVLILLSLTGDLSCMAVSLDKAGPFTSRKVKQSAHAAHSTH